MITERVSPRVQFRLIVPPPVCLKVDKGGGEAGLVPLLLPTADSLGEALDQAERW
jgi:hypothetical protein